MSIDTRSPRQMVGRKIGMLFVLASDEYPKGKSRLYQVRCDCQPQVVLRLRYHFLAKGHCGCKTSANMKIAKTKHGHACSPKAGRSTYNTWCGLWARCRNKNSPKYANYGGRGIAVCERWKKFENFLADMGEKPASLSLDRIDNDGNYEPSNCRWATLAMQARNRRSSKKIAFNGEVLNLVDWATRFGMSKNVLIHRLKLGWKFAEALTTPVKTISR